MKKWLERGGHGAIWLLGATLLTKIIGVLQKIPLQNVGGDAVFGLYNMVYPLYQLMLMITVSGIPTIISMMLVEGNPQDRERLAKSSHMFMLITGLVLAVLLYSLSTPIAQLLGSTSLNTMIQLLALTLCIAPLLASYRGYFQSIQLASYSSISQLIEQIVRVGVMVAILYFGVQQGWDDLSIATLVMWGGTAGACFAIIYLFSKRKSYMINHKVDYSNRSNQFNVVFYFRRGLLVVLAAVIVPLLSAIDSFTLPHLLLPFMSFTDVAEQFGLYSRIQPLVQLVTMLLAATLAGAIPRIVENKEIRTINGQKQLSLILRYTINIGSAATIGLYILAEPMSIMLYKNTLEVGWFKWLAFTTLPAAVLAVIAPMLLLEKRYGRLLMMVAVSFALKIALNIIFVTQAETMVGAVYATLITLYIVAAIALFQSPLLMVVKLKNTVYSIGALFAMGFTLSVMRYIGEHVIQLTLEDRLLATVYTLILVATGAVLLASIFFKLNIVKKEDIKQLLK